MPGESNVITCDPFTIPGFFMFTVTGLYNGSVHFKRLNFHTRKQSEPAHLRQGNVVR